MEKGLTLQEVHRKGKVTGIYVSHSTMSQYTVWQLNQQDAVVSVVIHDNENEIVVIYNSTTNKMMYLSPHTTLELKDLWVK